MCIVCIEWQKGKLTNKEAKRALSELLSAVKVESDEFIHYQDLWYDLEEEELNEDE